MGNVRFKAGHVILTQGDEGNTAYLIVHGAVEVIIGEGAKAKRLAMLGAGDVFGEMSLLAPGPRSATIRAVADTELAVTSYDDFMDSIRENPEQAMKFMKTLVVRLRKMNDLIASQDPKRGLIGVLREYISSAEIDDVTLSAEERERRIQARTMSILL